MALYDLNRFHAATLEFFNKIAYNFLLRFSTAQIQGGHNDAMLCCFDCILKHVACALAKDAIKPRVWPHTLIDRKYSPGCCRMATLFPDMGNPLVCLPIQAKRFRPDDIQIAPLEVAANTGRKHGALFIKGVRNPNERVKISGVQRV